MKKIIVFLALLLLMLLACRPEVDQELDQGHEETPASIENEAGVSGMTLEEIRVLARGLYDKRNELTNWLNMDCHTDFDETVPAIPDRDDKNPEGFSWRAVKKYKTLTELYEAFEEIYSPKMIEDIYPMWTEERWEGTPNEEKKDWDDVYFYIFKEIDGRLYVRDTWYNELPETSGRNFGALTIKVETVEKIVILVPQNADVENKYPAKSELVLVNDRWVINSFWQPDK